MSFKIAIDGPAGAGKSTIAKLIAKSLGIEYLDTGAMYRAITLKALRLGIDLNLEENYKFVYDTSLDFVNGDLFMDGENVSEEIRSLEVSNNVSLCCSFGIVREQMVYLQRKMSESKNVILDGRDIGTVVFPNAELKIYLIATPEVRAKRRMLERIEKGTNTQTLEETIKEIEVRDYKDSTRAISPLKKAEDAIEVDTSNMSIDAVVKEIERLVRERGLKMEDVKTTVNEETTNEQATEEKVEEQVEETATEETATEETATEETTTEVASEQQEQLEGQVEESTEEATEEQAEDTAAEETAEEAEEKPANTLKELQLVNGVVKEVLPAEPEKTDKEGKVYRKAKEARVVITLENGQEGYLFGKEVPGIESDDDLFDEFIEGDEVRLVVKKVYPDGGKVLLSATLLEKRDNLAKFEEVIKNHETFTAKVVKAIQVGLILEYDGYSCLLPTTQIAKVDDVNALVGTEMVVAPIRVDYNRIRLIVSQNVANAIKAKADKEEFISKINVGDVFEGTVKNIESYGAFIDLGNGVEGLLHISEVEHNRIVKIEKVLNVGDKVQVKVIKMSDKHIGLSRKALLPNYWKDFMDANSVDSVIKGTVAEINNSGVVVSLSEQVQGFLPKSEASWDKSAQLADLYKVGEEIEAKIIELDLNKKRVILSTKQLSENPWLTLTLKSGDTIAAKVQHVSEEGVNISYEGLTGFLPAANYGEKKEFEVGEEINVKVRVFDSQKNRLLVSMREAKPREQREKKVSSNRESNNMLKNQEKLGGTFGDFINLDDYKD